MLALVRGRDLLHPLPLSAVLLLVVNDHLLKGSSWAPPALTGKLSDVAGLFFFPILLVAIVRAVRPVKHAPVLAAALTAIVFTAIKVDARANAVAAVVLGSCALDPTDLVALPMTALAALFCVGRQHPGEGSRFARTAAMVIASLASVATSRVHQPPCPATPKSEAHRAFDTLCARSKGAAVTTHGASISILLELAPEAPGCSLPPRLAIDQELRPGLSARTLAEHKVGTLDQLSRIQLQVELPYPAKCEGLHLGLLAEQAIVDVPIASCK